MKQRRWRIIMLGALLGAIGAVLPMFAMARMSWSIASAKELGLLDSFGQRVLAKADATFEHARTSLVVIEGTNYPPCSPEHMAEMRDETISSATIEEIGYFNDGQLRCSSWGLSKSGHHQSKTDFVTNDGLLVTLRMKPNASFGQQMTALQLGSHNALVLPSRFIDVVADEKIGIVLMTDKGLLVAQHGNVVKGREWLPPYNPGHGISGDYFYSVSHSNGLVALVTEPKTNVASQYYEELKLYLPVGCFIALFIVAVVVWLSRKRLSPEGELEFGVRNREFYVVYQPIIELKTGICVGAEALVRWRRPDGSVVRPDFFIPLAEETGLIRDITDQVIERVILELGATLRGDRSLHIAINLSADDIHTGRVLDVLRKKLQHTDVRPEQIWLEATERGFIDLEPARKTLLQARKHGHSVAIDDFGTGYSSLASLQALPLDALKIDKSFVSTIGKGSATSSVILHIIDMARDLGYFLVAEGIETQQQLDFLTEHSVDFGQGFLIARPLSAEELQSFHMQRKKNFGVASEVIRVSDRERQ